MILDYLCGITETTILKYEALELTLKHSPFGIAITDRDLKYIAYSDAWVTLNSLEALSLTGMTHLDLFPEIKSREDWMGVYNKALDGQSDYSPFNVHHDREGNPIYTRWYVRPWIHKETNSVGGLILIYDIIGETVAEVKARVLRGEL